MLPLRVGEIRHTPDLLQLRSQSKHLFASDIYEIASSAACARLGKRTRNRYPGDVQGRAPDVGQGRSLR